MLLRRLFKASPIYPPFRIWRDTQALRRWSPDDEVRRAFYAHLVQPGDLVFDIGANIGNRAKVFLRLGAQVIAFEPQQLCAAVLRKGLAENASFRVVREALGAKPGTAELRLSDAHFLATLSEAWIDTAHQSGRFSDQRWDRTEQVPVTTLDAAIARFGLPKFVKIDVEGFEFEVVSGLSRPVPSGSLEFMSETLNTALACLEKLESLATYRFRFSYGETMEWAWTSWEPLTTARSTLERLASADDRAWGDVYFRMA